MKLSKTLLLSVLWLACLFSVSFAYTTEEIQAYNYAYKNYITTMPSINQADMWWDLTRIAMAKMLSTYAINVLWLTPDKSKDCSFYDVSSTLDAKYGMWVTRACELGLMWVGIYSFRPYDSVTRAEFGTVLSRALNGKDKEKLEEMNSVSPYYYDHLRYLQREWIMTNISNPTSKLERRWRVLLMLMRADKSYVPEEIDYPTTHSSNKLDTITRNVYTEWCDWTTQKLNDSKTYHDMPNNNWINDVKFVNKALQDVRDNWEHLVKNYIAEANRVLDSAWLTKRDQCRYSLLIDELENQKWYIKSYKTENGRTIVWIDFLSYKENISWDDMTPYGGWYLLKNTSTKLRYYTLSDNVELELLNVDANWYTKEKDGRIIYGRDRKHVSNWNVRLNAFCNNEPVYNWERWRVGEWEEEGIINRNKHGRLCTKTMIDGDEYGYGASLLDFKFDATWNIDRISWLIYWLTNAW